MLERIKDKISDVLYNTQYNFKEKLSNRCRKCPAFTSNWNPYENDGDCGCVFKGDFTCMWAMDDFEVKCAWWILPRRITRIFAEKAAQRAMEEEVARWEEYSQTLYGDEF